MSQQITAWQDRLRNEYTALAYSRPDGLPIHVIEAGLSARERDQLMADVKACFQARGLWASVWKANPLPLLFAATQVGYQFQGGFAGFWPHLADELGDPTSFGAPNERQELIEHFMREAQTYSFATPQNTPWTRRFNLIAWPITNALLPREVQLPFTTLLSKLTSSINTLSIDKASQLIQRFGARIAGNRFEDWTARSSSAALVIDFLSSSPNHFDSGLLKRLEEDVTAHERAQRNLARARAAVEASTSQSVVSTCALEISYRDNVVSVWLRAPQTPNGAELARAMRRAFFAPKLWGEVPATTPGELVGGGLIKLRDMKWPGPAQPLLPGLDEEPYLDAKTKAWLATLNVDTTTPLIFDATAAGEDVVGGGLIPQGAGLTKGRRYVALVDATTKAPRDAEASLDGSIEGVLALMLDLSKPEHRAWVAKVLRLPLLNTTTTALLTPPPLKPYGAARYARDPIAAYEDTNQGPPELFVLEERATPSRDPKHAAGLSYEVTDATPPRSFVSLHLSEHASPRAPTISSLLKGEATLRVESLLPLQHIELDFEVATDSGRWCGRAHLDELPYRSTARDWLWENVYGDDAEALRDALLKVDSAHIRVNVGCFVEDTWLIEEPPFEHWWTENGPVSDSGALLEVTVSGEQSLLITSATPVTPAATPSGIELRLASRADGEVLVSGGRCIAPKGSIPLNAFSPLKQRLLRQRQSKKRALGLEEVHRSWVAWTSADAQSLALVEITCGPAWRQLEEELRGPSWGPLRTFWEKFVDACLSAGAIAPVPNEARARFVAQVAGALRSHYTYPGRAQHSSKLGENLAKFTYQAAALLERDHPTIDAADVMIDDDTLLALAKTQPTKTLAELIFPVNSSDIIDGVDCRGRELQDMVEPLYAWGKASSHALCGGAWSRAQLTQGLHFWLSPEEFTLEITNSARGALMASMLSDQLTSRAIRYCVNLLNQGAR